ncbi:TATA-binding protein-associated factor mot1, partial [Ascosphaera atra]
MDLLAKLCTFPTVLEAMKKNAERDVESSFEKLVPRLFPFLRHTITSVRSAVLRALLTFLRLDGRKHNAWVDGKAMRLVFQNLLVERNEGVLKLSLQVWFEILQALEARDAFASDATLLSSVQPLINLTMGAFGLPRAPIPMDVTLFIRPSGFPYSPAPIPYSRRKQSVASPGEAGSRTAGRRRRTEKASPPPVNLAHNVDGHMMSGDVDLVGMDTIIRSKIHAAIAL